RLGSGHPAFVPYRNYRGADGGLFFLSCFTEKFWSSLCDALDRADLKSDARSANNVARCRNRAFVDGELQAIFGTRSTADWLAQLAKFNIPAMRVQDLDYALRRDPQIAHNKTVVEVDHPSAGKVEMLALPINFHGTPARYERAAPRLGEHSVEILREFGFAQDEIDSLLRSEAVAGLRAKKPA
ncbi:MAG: CoA transferase, partial [Pseudomonadota bacterium]